MKRFPMRLLFALLLSFTPLAAEVNILVAYFSKSGNTEKMAKALDEGAGGVKGVTASLKKISEVTQADLKAADGLAVGSPVYMRDVAPMLP